MGKSRFSRSYLLYLLIIFLAACTSVNSAKTPALPATIPIQTTSLPASVPSTSNPALQPTTPPAIDQAIPPTKTSALEQPIESAPFRILGQGMLTGSPVYSPDGKYLAIPSSAGVFIYAAQTNELIRTLPAIGFGTHLAVSPDSRFLASGSGRDIAIWGLPDGVFTQNLSLNESAEILSLAFSPNGQILAASYFGSKSSDGKMDRFSAAWNLENRKQVFNVSGTSIRFSPDSALFLTTNSSNDGDLSTYYSYDYELPANPDDRVFLYKTTTGELLRQWQAQAADFLTDQQLILEADGATRVVDLRTDQVNFAFNGRHASASQDGKYLALYDRGEISLYSLADGKFLRRVEKIRQLEDIPIGILDTEGLSFSPDGEILSGAQLWTPCSNCIPGGSFTASWRVSDGSFINAPHKVNSAWAPQFSSDGSTLLVAQPTRVDFYNPTDGSTLGALDQFSGSFDTLAFSPDGNVLATASGEPVRNIRFWDWQTGNELRRFKDEAGNSGSWEGDLSYSSDGNLIGYAGNFWQVDSGERLRKFEDAYLAEYSFSPSSLAFAPQGNQLALGFISGVLQLWNPSDLSRIGQPQAEYTGTVTSLSYSSDGKLLAAVYNYPDYIVQLWQLPELTKGTIIPGKYFLRAAISPDGQTLATLAGKDNLTNWGKVHLWSLTGELLRSLEISDANRIAYSPDGHIIATGSISGVVRLWQVSDGALLAILPSLPSSITGLAFSPDGKALAACSIAGVTYIWSIQ